METPAQKCARIISALEDLVAQEGAALGAGDFTAAHAIQERTEPLVSFLVSQPEHASEPRLRRRIEALHARRTQHSERLAGRIAQVRGELQETTLHRRHVAQVAPAYGRSTKTRHQLSAIG